MIVIGLATFLTLYWTPKHVQKEFNGVNISNETGESAVISFDLTVKKKLFVKDRIDGTVTVNGAQYEVSSYAHFNKNGDRVDVEDGNSLWSRIMGKVKGESYSLQRMVSDYNNGSISMDLQMMVTLSRDFEKIAPVIFEHKGEGSKSGITYMAPATDKEAALQDYMKFK